MSAQFVCKRPWELTPNEYEDDADEDHGAGVDDARKLAKETASESNNRSWTGDGSSNVDHDERSCSGSRRATPIVDRNKSTSMSTIGLADILWWSTITLPQTGITFDIHID